MGRIATSPMRSRGSTNKGTKSKVAHKWADLLHHPFVLGGPQTRGQSQMWPTGGQNCYIAPVFSGVPKTRGQSQRWPANGQNCYITLAFRGLPKQGDKVKCAPEVGGIATSPLRARGSANKGTKSKVAHKWAELLHHPCVLGGPQTRGQSQRWPANGRNCYITPAFSGVPKQGDKVKGAPQVGGSATSPLRSRGSPNKGTKSKVAHKWAQLLDHPCVLGCSQTRGQSQRWRTSGRNRYITPAFSGVPKQGDKVKGGRKMGRIATSPLRSRGSPNKGTKSKVPQKWAEVLHQHCVLGGPQTRGQSQRWRTSGHNCYITHAFSGVRKQGDKVKGGAQVGGIATSPLRSRGSPNKGTKSKVPHKCAQLLHHPCVLGGPQTRGQSQRWPANGQNCYITPAFSAVPKQGDKIKGAPQVGGIATSPLRSAGVPKQGDKAKGGAQVGGIATSPLRSRGSPNKGTKSKVAGKSAKLLDHPCVLLGPQTRGQNQRCPTRGRNCYITLAFSGVPKQEDKVKGGRQMGRIATSPLRSRGSPNKRTKSKVPHKWAELLHHPCVLGGPQTRGQSQRCTTSGRNCYITLTFSGVPKQEDSVKGGPQVGGSTTSPLRSWGSPNKATKSKVPHKWAQLLHHPCVPGGPQTRGQSQRCPTSVHNCYITPAFLGVPKQGDKFKGARQVGKIATSALRSRGSPNKDATSKVAHKWTEGIHHPGRSRGSPNKETKSKVPHKWAELLHHPCVLGGPQTRGQSQRWRTSGRNCYITPSFSGVPKQGDKVKCGPQVGRIATSHLRSRGSPKQGDKVKGGRQMGRIATSPLRSGGSPNKGTKLKVPHKWAEVLHHPCVLGGPQTRGQSQRWPTIGRNCHITLAFSGVPKGGDKVKGGPQVGRIATSPLRSRGSTNKETKSKVPHKWAELLHHPCVLGGPQTRRQNQRCPTSGRNCYINLAFSGVPKQEEKVKGGRQMGRIATSPLRSRGVPKQGEKIKGAPQVGGSATSPPAFSGVPKQEDKGKGGPQVDGSTTSPLRSQGSPKEGTKSKVPHKWAELLHHPCVLGGPITPAFSGFPKQGDKVKGGPQVGTIATSPLCSRGSPNKGTKSKVSHKWAELLHHPCVLGGPQRRGQSQRWPASGQNCYISLAFWGVPLPLRSRGSPNKGTKSKVPHKWAEWLHHPCVLGGPQTRGQSQRCPTSGRNCYITPAFGVPKQGDKIKGAPQVDGSATSPLRSGSPNKKKKSKVAPDFSGVRKQGDNVKGGAQVGRMSTSPLRSWGSPNKGTKSKVAHKWTELLPHPCVLGGPQRRGQSQRSPASEQKRYITLAFSGGEKQVDKVKGGPQVGGSATSPLRSGGSPNKGRKLKVTNKWAEVLHHPSALQGPQTRGQNQRWPTSGQNCDITLAFLVVPKQGDKVKGRQQVGGSATSPLRSRGSPNKGTKSKVAHKWTEVLQHPGRSQGSPNKGTKSKVARKWAEAL